MDVDLPAPILKKRDLFNRGAWVGLETYVPQESDVWFKWGRQFSFANGSASDFYEKWRPEGLMDIFVVTKFLEEPEGDPRQFLVDSEFLVARFNNVAAAVHCKLWLD